MYGTVEGADTYHEARANAAWTGSNDAKAAALLRASDWIDGAYGPRFVGTPVGDAEWPRSGAVDSRGVTLPDDEVPTRVENATYEAALRELTSPGSLAPDFVAAAAVKREKVDVVEVEYSGAFTAADARPVVGVVEHWLAPLLAGRGFPAFLVV